MASTNIRDMIDRPDHPMLKRAFNEIIEIVCHSDSSGMAPVDAWFKRLIEETVPHGKCIRGMLLLSTYQMVETSSNTESLELATIAFWLIEMSQALALILDDFVDRAQTRRGRVCWHLRDDVGSMALYDVFLLEQGIYEVMRRRFKNHRHYVDFLELTHEIALITIKGQSLDMLAERGRLSSEEVYKELINAKTALYTFYLPVRFGLLLAHKDDFALHMKVREFSLKIGSIFQQQDDFLDCYGDPSATGKIGTDITDGKCTWFYVTAMKLADESQRKVLEENYGQGKPGGSAESKVKAIYEELALESRFQEFINEQFHDAKDFLVKCDFPFLSFDLALVEIEGRPQHCRTDSWVPFVWPQLELV